MSELVFVFNGDERGCYAGSTGAFVRADLPLSMPDTPERTRDELITAAIAEFDRRIAREPKQVIHHRMKTCFLHNAGCGEAAQQAALAWIRLTPREYEPRVALVDIEMRRRSGMDGFDPHNDWAKRPHASYALWRLFNNPSQNTEHFLRYRGALLLPFARDRVEWYLAEFFALEDAQWLLVARKHGTLILLCDLWQEAASRQKGIQCDRSYLILRAAANLARGQYDQARIEAEAAAQMEQDGLLWCGNTRTLLDAIDAQDRRLNFECQDDPCTFCRWRAKLNVAIP